MESFRLSPPRTVTGNAEGPVSRDGLVWLTEAADLTSLSAGLGDAFDSLPWRSHRPGRTKGQMVLAMADGATCLSDLAVLRDQPAVADTANNRVHRFNATGAQLTLWVTLSTLSPSSPPPGTSASPPAPRSATTRSPPRRGDRDSRALRTGGVLLSSVVRDVDPSGEQYGGLVGYQLGCARTRVASPCGTSSQADLEMRGRVVGVGRFSGAYVGALDEACLGRTEEQERFRAVLAQVAGGDGGLDGPSSVVARHL